MINKYCYSAGTGTVQVCKP